MRENEKGMQLECLRSAEQVASTLEGQIEAN
jgi:hypothetical protein